MNALEQLSKSGICGRYEYIRDAIKKAHREIIFFLILFFKIFLIVDSVFPDRRAKNLQYVKSEEFL